MWHWIDCGFLDRYVIDLAGMWHHCTSHYRLSDLLSCAPTGMPTCVPIGIGRTIVLMSTYHLSPLLFFHDSIHHCC